MEAQTMNPDQLTLTMEANTMNPESDLGPYCLHYYKAIKVHTQIYERADDNCCVWWEMLEWIWLYQSYSADL